MPKRFSSKVANQVNPSPLRSQSSGRFQLDENTIEEMAKIFMQTQANMVNSNKPQTTNSQEALVLLQQINSKLENLQDSFLASGDSDNQSHRGDQPTQNQQQTQSQQSAQTTNESVNGSDVSQELKKLFSTLLTNNNQANASGDGQAPNTNNQKPMQQQGQNTTQNTKQNSSIAVQTAAQVLSQAQYELSNELEASLKSLKQVISESEKIANKISSLLGEENDQQQ